MKKISFGWAVAIVLVGGGCSNTVAEADLQASILNDFGASGSLRAEQFEGLVAKAEASSEIELIDVRTAEENAEGCLGYSKNIDFYAADFGEQIEKLDKEKTYLVYCRSGNRSGQTVDLMRTKGFKSVYDLEGGMANWQSTGKKVASNCG